MAREPLPEWVGFDWTWLCALLHCLSAPWITGLLIAWRYWPFRVSGWEHLTVIWNSSPTPATSPGSVIYSHISTHRLSSPTSGTECWVQTPVDLRKSACCCSASTSSAGTGWNETDMNSQRLRLDWDAHFFPLEYYFSSITGAPVCIDLWIYTMVRLTDHIVRLPMALKLDSLILDKKPV